MKFRNYVPHDKQLQEGKLAPPVLPKFEDPVAAAPPPSAKEVTDYFHYGILLVALTCMHSCSFIFKYSGSICEYCSKETKLGP
jgi:hypothetical protein